MDSSLNDFIYSAIGVIGGVLVALSQIPSIVLVHKRQQSLDISYAYQFILGIAILLAVIYFAYYKSVMVYTTAFSLTPALYLVGLKFLIEKRNARRAANSKCAVNGVTLEHALLPEDAKHNYIRINPNVTADLMPQLRRTNGWQVV